MVVNFILENCHLLSRTDEHHTPTIYFGNSTIMINTYILLRKLCLPLLFCILVSFTSYKLFENLSNLQTTIDCVQCPLVILMSLNLEKNLDFFPVSIEFQIKHRDNVTENQDSKCFKKQSYNLLTMHAIENQFIATVTSHKTCRRCS